MDHLITNATEDGKRRRQWKSWQKIVSVLGCIVVFCTGECTAAEEIAAELHELGIIEAPIHVLEGGWEVLKASGMSAD